MFLHPLPLLCACLHNVGMSGSTCTTGNKVEAEVTGYEVFVDDGCLQPFGFFCGRTDRYVVALEILLKTEQPIEDREVKVEEKMVDGYCGFLFLDKNGLPEVAMHWQHRFSNMVDRFNAIYRGPLPNVTPHFCRHTYCSNMARSGMNPKTLQYLMGHSDISVTMNTYTHLGLDGARDEMVRLEELEKARKEVEKSTPKSENNILMFRVG